MQGRLGDVLIVTSLWPLASRTKKESCRNKEKEKRENGIKRSSRRRASLFSEKMHTGKEGLYFFFFFGRGVVQPSSRLLLLGDVFECL